MSASAGSVALVGGTGREGRGLATRFALAGRDVWLGSRDPARAVAAADEIAARLGQRLGDSGGSLRGGTNRAAAAAAGIVVLVVPWEAHRATIEELAPVLSGRIVVDAVVPLRFERGVHPIDVSEGSACEQAAALLPDARVVGAFHHLAAELLVEFDRAIEADVLIAGADREAKAEVAALAESIEGVRAIDAGPLRFARVIEPMTALLVGLNGRYRATSGLRITGLPGGFAPPER